MKVLVAGCSLSSGWGFDQGRDDPRIWPNMINAQVTNIAQTAASNYDIFLASLWEQTHNHYDLVLTQFTALDRITIASSTESLLILNTINPTLPQPMLLKHIPLQDLGTFARVMTMANNLWKSFHDLIIMTKILSSQATPNYFINGMLPWEDDFFAQHDRDDVFTRNLLTIDTDHAKLKEILKQSKLKFNSDQWVNLIQDWQTHKLDSIADEDPHPGIASQRFFAEQVNNFLKEKQCQI